MYSFLNTWLSLATRVLKARFLLEMLARWRVLTVFQRQIRKNWVLDDVRGEERGNIEYGSLMFTEGTTAP